MLAKLQYDSDHAKPTKGKRKPAGVGANALRGEDAMAELVRLGKGGKRVA